MKISEIFNNRANISGITAREERPALKAEKSGFRSHLQQIEGRNLEERINQLAEKIFEQGKKLEQKTDIVELKKYKKLISEFLDEAVGNSRKFLKRNFLDRRGRYRVYAIVKKINEELERLTEEVLSEEKDKIRILERLDELKGLILDLLI